MCEPDALPTPVDLAVFADPQALAGALAERVADALAARLRLDERTTLAVSGGRTPEAFFRALSRRRLDWSRVAVTLVDERWVPETSPRSNAALIRRHLLQNAAAAAHFVPLYTGDPSPEAGLTAAEAALAALPWPAAAVVLGMGDDGHTASFFPQGEGLADALAPATSARLAVVRADAAGEPRITLTLPEVTAADLVVLHIEGAGKRAVLDEARRGGPVTEMPVRAVLRAAPRPLCVMWCP